MHCFALGVLSARLEIHSLPLWLNLTFQSLNSRYSPDSCDIEIFRMSYLLRSIQRGLHQAASGRRPAGRSVARAFSAVTQTRSFSRVSSRFAVTPTLHSTDRSPLAPRTPLSTTMHASLRQIALGRREMSSDSSSEKHIEVGVEAPATQQDTIFGKITRGVR